MIISFHGQQFSVSRSRDGDIKASGSPLPNAAIDDFLNKRDFPVTLCDGDLVKHSRAVLRSIEAGHRDFELRLVEAWS